jgi:hypothetical protein
MALELDIKVIAETPEEARAQLKDLLDKPLVSTNGATEASAAETRSAKHEVAQRKIDMIWSRVGPNIRKLLTAAASFDDGYQTADLAKAMKVTPVKLRSYAANLGRSVKSVNAKIKDDGRIYYWDDGQGKWVMPEPIRKAILSKTN